LLFDHWGGLNTLFHTLSCGGVVLSLHERSPEKVCAFIEKHKIELLPASPTFLNLLILSESYKNYDLSSLKLITYGTEPMPESTLKRIKEIFHSVKLQQTYGLIELGVLRSKSKSEDSLWVKIGGEGYSTRVVDGILQIKADSAMLGYLNAPSPFTEDGYFITGDAVNVEGEYLKILGRKSELINVGGEKVYPVEVENVIIQFHNVSDVTVFSEKNPITGNIVCARISLINPVDKKEFIKNLKKYCRERLQSYKVPVKVFITNEIQHTERFKKKRADV
jgi:acyl-CoA synthetase (AMP-forming)/AMP-acid ligase II